MISGTTRKIHEIWRKAHSHRANFDDSTTHSSRAIDSTVRAVQVVEMASFEFSILQVSTRQTLTGKYTPLSLRTNALKDQSATAGFNRGDADYSAFAQGNRTTHLKLIRLTTATALDAQDRQRLRFEHWRSFRLRSGTIAAAGTATVDIRRVNAGSDTGSSEGVTDRHDGQYVNRRLR